jgi:2-keto-4-pentenoate hydratase/2-oxohepta-3-ene-1,7-dioic acid hydratase in catechol pathway
MKAGRYLLNGKPGLFLVGNDERLLDWGALDGASVPDPVRRVAVYAMREGTDAAFCSALPELEKFLANDGAFLREAEPLGRGVEFQPPVRPRTFICVGLNYRDHAQESAMELPKFPLLFAKTSNAIHAHNLPVSLPPESKQVDYEAELAVVIGKACSRVKAADALDYVAGFTCANDISARDFQFADNQWYRGKSADGFGPIGPWIVAQQQVGDGSGLRIQLRLNGKVMQDSTTANLIFDVPALIEYISRSITLNPGDVILTGTPPGVGFARKPPVYLQSGDKMEVEIEKIGTLVNQIS